MCRLTLQLEAYREVSERSHMKQMLTSGARIYQLTLTKYTVKVAHARGATGSPPGLSVTVADLSGTIS